MPVISGGKVIEGAIGEPYLNAGAPSAGTDQIWTVTLGGTPTGGSFTLTFMGKTTAAINWNSTNATLIAAVDAALEALNTIGTGGVVTAAGTLTAGIGTITVTAGGNLTKALLPNMSADGTLLTGTSPTVAVAITTPGVDATGRGLGVGQLYIDTTAGKLYINSGSALAPTWTVVGAQS